jgi:hypothetical protein
VTVVGSRYGKDNQYVTEPGKGFTVICNDCGLIMTDDSMGATYCVFCELVPTVRCPGCKQKVFLHDSLLCESEVNYVQGDERPLGQLRDSAGGK